MTARHYGTLARACEALPSMRASVQLGGTGTAAALRNRYSAVILQAGSLSLLAALTATVSLSSPRPLPCSPPLARFRRTHSTRKHKCMQQQRALELLLRLDPLLCISLSQPCSGRR